ncbi:hypothetical protein [Roseibium sp.]|uniref:globin domain-containing protein n=1 Tax=Roseibium sp. TaxID=1936156 RepID=UPI003A979401
MTLYLDLGGRPALRHATTRLLTRLQLDPLFAETTLSHQNDLQEDLIEFLCFIFEGAPVYEGRTANEMLGPYCACDQTFDHLVDHIVTVLIGSTGASPLETTIRARFDRLRPILLKPDSDDSGSPSPLLSARVPHSECVPA